jgi:hypothetical protein
MQKEERITPLLLQAAKFITYLHPDFAKQQAEFGAQKALPKPPMQLWSGDADLITEAVEVKFEKEK